MLCFLSIDQNKNRLFQSCDSNNVIHIRSVQQAICSVYNINIFVSIPLTIFVRTMSQVKYQSYFTMQYELYHDAMLSGDF